MKDSKQEILKFWFEELSQEQWFQGGSSLDEQIKERFLPLYELAAQGLCNDWMHSAEGTLALILVLDQFPRNMFRGTARMYESDGQALRLAKYAVAQGYDTDMNVDERGFMYLPFEHSEQPEDQECAVKLFGAMKNLPDAAGWYDYALRHKEVVDRFGRFPHRNDILGRTSTSEEMEYLAQPDAGF